MNNGNGKKPVKDWRFPIAHKEAKIGIVLAVFYFIWWYDFAYGLGAKPVDTYSYIMGLPSCFFTAVW